MNMKASTLITYLSKHPEAIIKFDENRHYHDELIDVTIADFIYKPKANIFILPNLCLCLPEPD